MLQSVTPQFCIEQTDEAGGVVCLVLVGELDLDAERAFVAHLERLKRDRPHVRLDISRLTFLDVAGLRAVMLEVAHARRDGWDLEVGRNVTAPVRRLIDLAGVAPVLWP